MMQSKRTTLYALLALSLFVSSCSSSRKAVKDPIHINNTGQLPTGSNTTDTPEAAFHYIKQVNANAVTSKNMVSNIDFNLKSGSKDISVDGKLSMRRDEVIRLQLTFLGMEVGRMEFSKDTVLIMDRMHKQYVKVGYEDISFLKNNGITFHSLQALFWNELFVPGHEKMGDKEMRQFQLDGNSISLSNGKMKYVWDTDPSTAQINRAQATYQSSSHGSSSLDWNYSKFKSFQSSLFPTNHSVKFNISSGKEMNVNITLKGLKDDSDWDTVTKITSKYKPVSFQTVINLIMNLK